MHDRTAPIGAPTSVLGVSSRKTVIVEGERRFPASVAADLLQRQSRALASSTGRVLDLSDPAARSLVASTIDNGFQANSEQWDFVLSIAELIRFPDLAAAMNAIDSLLAPGGRLLAVEPIAKPGTMRVLALAPWALTPWVRGFHVGRDLTAALRTTSLVNDDIERFTMPTAVAPLRYFISLGARRVVSTLEVQP